ncbi:uncharacterized protein [Choristoneura fumiferana]|uniref:uncharacterized protein n=1 Tax=Choristoneura fumiferana TaxID=7141 RepID=UPI003D15591A
MQNETESGGGRADGSESVKQGSLESKLNKSVKIAAPGAFSFVPEEWPKYKARFTRYMSLSGAGKSSEKDKIDCLLYCMGEKAEDILIQFYNIKDYNSLIKEFDNFFAPKRNVIFERYKFNSCVQKEEEKVDDFITQLHKLAINCEFGSLKDDLIRDRLVIGIRDRKAGERMLLKNDLTLEEATLLCRQAEMQEEGKELLEKKEDLRVNRMKQNKGKTSEKCWFCGLERHQKHLCPAYKATCHNCQRVGHFAKLCRAKAVRNMEEIKNETVFKEQM